MLNTGPPQPTHFKRGKSTGPNAAKRLERTSQEKATGLLTKRSRVTSERRVQHSGAGTEPAGGRLDGEEGRGAGGTGSHYVQH